LDIYNFLFNLKLCAMIATVLKIDRVKNPKEIGGYKIDNADVDYDVLSKDQKGTKVAIVEIAVEGGKQTIAMTARQLHQVLKDGKFPALKGTETIPATREAGC
jgi:hypothetical protein